MSLILFDVVCDLGVSCFEVFLKVVLLFICFGIFVGFFMVLIYFLDDFVVIFFVIGNGFFMFLVEIYLLVRRGVFLKINVFFIFIFMFIVLIVIGYYFIS